jgi:hypothetical protein
MYAVIHIKEILTVTRPQLNKKNVFTNLPTIFISIALLHIQ